VVRSDQVLELLDWLNDEGIRAWVDGGWGVDVLLGKQTREHADLDLVVDVADLDRIVAYLTSEGFEVVRDWLPTAIAFAHQDGRAVDLHPVELAADGGGDQIQRDGVTRFRYDPPTTGRLGGREVPCCTLQTQFASHLGYDPQEADIADMRALAEHFNVDPPAPYGGRQIAYGYAVIVDRLAALPLAPPGDAAAAVYDRPIALRQLHQDPETGSEHYLVRYPGGLKGRVHTHRAAHTIVVLDGTLWVNGRTIGPGAYAHFPAGQPMQHQAGGDGPCLFVLLFDGPFDVEVVDVPH